MNRATDAESLERNVFRSFWQDGLLDCFAGIGLLGLGVAWVTGHAALGAAIPALLVPIWPLVRKRVTAPRIGEVRFTPARRDKEGRKFTHVGLTLGVGLFAATVFFLLRSGRADISVLRSWIAALPAALLGLMSLVTALLWSLRRFLAMPRSWFSEACPSSCSMSIQAGASWRPAFWCRWSARYC